MDYKEFPVCSQDDAEAKNYVSQVLVGALLEHFLFKFFILTVNICNIFIIAFQTNPDISKIYDTVIIVCEHTALVVFILEILLKWFYGFSVFWKNGWNVLDFMLSLSVTGSMVMFGQEETKIVSCHHFLLLNSRHKVIQPSLSLIFLIHQFLKILFPPSSSLPDMSSIFIILGFLMLMFAILGTVLFKAAFPSVFSNLTSVLYILFVCITQDGWAGIYQELKSVEGPLYAASLYLCAFITGGAFLFANLLIAVVATNLETAITYCDEPNSEDDCLLKDRNIIHVDEVAAKTNMTRHQTPWTDTFLDNLSVDITEQIALVIGAIEKNERAYVRTIEELQAVVDKVHSLSYNREKDKEMIMRNQMAASLQEDLFSNEIAMGRSGDILSTLITLEKANIINSSVNRPNMFTTSMVQNHVRQLSAAVTAAHSTSASEHGEFIAEIHEN
ncbi:cation channel sperm-associated protein 4-like [Electrophorus electricus]|uniref:cation channel sperm-associated protein 4-like n=1 Tax=Electrophorus electricus TaxID=8005 RepID=UPI0015D05E32|nr:cation channel sperm-associated protein 4-like [Electrophorus electricus]